MNPQRHSMQSRRSVDNNNMRQSYMTTSGSTRWSASSNPHNTIALFGAGSKTATHFLRLALDAGYHVRALLIMPSSSEPSSFRNHPTNETVVAAKALKALFADQAALHWVRADSVYDARACKRVLRGAHYVVCMMNDAPLTCDSDGLSSRDGRRKKSSSHSLKTTSKERTHMSCSDPSKPLTSFLQILYPLMKEEASIQVFLYQSTSLAADVKGKTPIFSKVLKAVSAVRGAASNILPGPRHSVNSLVLGDQDAVVHEIAFHHRRIAMKPPPTKDEDVQENPTEDVDKAHFSYIITRPTAFLKDGPSTRTVSASKSQPGPFPISHVDLAEFSLNALLTNKLYNSCPYVVADSF